MLPFKYAKYRIHCINGCSDFENVKVILLIWYKGSYGTKVLERTIIWDIENDVC